jgi:hypothetical protein
MQQALASASEWARFADPKALGVLVILGLSVSDLLDHANALVHAHRTHHFWAWVATGGFYAACVLAACTVAAVSIALFPRLGLWRKKEETHPRGSLYYFGGIAEFKTAADYEAALRVKTPEQLGSDLARQTYEVAKVTRRKHRWAQRAYVVVILFLFCWAAARFGLALAGG